MALTEIKLRSLLAAAAPGKHSDKDGLYLRIDKRGGAYWQWRLRGRTGETVVSHGPYPEVTLAKARELHREARELWRQGIHPNDAKRKRRERLRSDTDNGFEVVAREWFGIRKSEWVAGYSSKIIRRLEADVFPYLGKTPVADLQPLAVLDALRRIEARGALETAHRALESIGQICRYAVATARANSDPTRDLRGALQQPVVRHFAAVTEPTELGALLRAIDGYSGTPVVRAALRLAPMLLLRPSELRFSKWSEIDLAQGTLTIPAHRMKRKRAGKLYGDPHVVPLSSQAIAILKDLRLLTWKEDGFVFPGERDHLRAMSENTTNAALRRLGYDTRTEMTTHGFRATARTILDEHLGFAVDVIEAQLAHTVKDSLGRAYNRTQHMRQRVLMLQAWADYLDGLRKPSPAHPSSDAKGSGSFARQDSELVPA